VVKALAELSLRAWSTNAEVKKVSQISQRAGEAFQKILLPERPEVSSQVEAHLGRDA